jgi:hypothetical protein
VSDNTIEMTSSKGAKWKTTGPLPEVWLPWVAHIGVTIMWLAIYVHRVPDPYSDEFGLGVLAGALVWPAIGAGRLAGGDWLWKVLAGGLLLGMYLVFRLYLPHLLRLAQ